MFTCAQGVKEPSWHAFRSHLAGQLRQDKIRLIKSHFNKLQSMFFRFLFQHNNGQQEAID